MSASATGLSKYPESGKNRIGRGRGGGSRRALADKVEVEGERRLGPPHGEAVLGLLQYDYLGIARVEPGAAGRGADLQTFVWPTEPRIPASSDLFPFAACTARELCQGGCAWRESAAAPRLHTHNVSIPASNSCRMSPAPPGHPADKLTCKKPREGGGGGHGSAANWRCVGRAEG